MRRSSPLYLVTTVEFRLWGSWKVTVSVVLLLTLSRTMVGASGGPDERGSKELSVAGERKLKVRRSEKTQEPSPECS